jgi:hypothetical protein
MPREHQRLLTTGTKVKINKKKRKDIKQRERQGKLSKNPSTVLEKTDYTVKQFDKWRGYVEGVPKHGVE